VASISRKTVSFGVYGVKFDLNILRQSATEVEGTFRVNGSTKRMRDLQAAFETPPRVSTDCSYVAACGLIDILFSLSVREIAGLEK
jgi:hypothetical protein